MDNELRKIVNQTATQKKLRVTPSVLQHLEDYDGKWKSRGGANWNTLLIQAVLADSAIKNAEEKGSGDIDEHDAKHAITTWHGEGEPTECLEAGLNIMRQSREPNFAAKYKLHPEIEAYVKKITS